MGWKAFKEHFGITHIVEVVAGQIQIGSDYVRDLARVDPMTGRVSGHDTFPGFLATTYPALLAAPRDEIVRLLGTRDEFSANIPVFTYRGAEIIEARCEKVGYPNVTHDGALMYDNTFSTDKATAVARAKRNARLGVRYGHEARERAERALAEINRALDKEEEKLARLERDHPDVVAAEE